MEISFPLPPLPSLLPVCLPVALSGQSVPFPSYCGSPWPKKDCAVGNGGLSLRHVGTHLRLIKLILQQRRDRLWRKNRILKHREIASWKEESTSEAQKMAGERLQDHSLTSLADSSIPTKQKYKLYGYDDSLFSFWCGRVNWCRLCTLEQVSLIAFAPLFPLFVPLLAFSLFLCVSIVVSFLLFLWAGILFFCLSIYLLVQFISSDLMQSSMCICLLPLNKSDMINAKGLLFSNDGACGSAEPWGFHKDWRGRLGVCGENVGGAGKANLSDGTVKSHPFTKEPSWESYPLCSTSRCEASYRIERLYREGNELHKRVFINENNAKGHAYERVKEMKGEKENDGSDVRK